MKALFVAGAGTDIGKTYIAAHFIEEVVNRGRPVRAFKPLVSGVPDWGDSGFAGSDTALLLGAQGLPLTLANVEACSPWRFRAPLSPDMAARAEGRTLTLQPVVEWTRAAVDAIAPGTLALIEGVGGVMSPISEDATGLDWLEQIGCPVLLVVGSYLGGVSHALTALEALRSRDIEVFGVAVNETAGATVALADAVSAIARFAPGVRVEAVPLGGRPHRLAEAAIVG